MEADFPTSPSKRRRTMSPEEPTPAAASLPEEASKDALVTDAPTTDAVSSEPNILDMLMQQVEAQTDSAPISATNTGAQPSSETATAAPAVQEVTQEATIAPDVDMAAVETQALQQIQSQAVPTANGTSEVVTDQPAEREWETDSSPYESSDSDTSSDSSDDSDEDADGDYAMMNPEEAARILMDDGSDDEGKTKDNAGAGLRTINERPEEVIPKPDVTVTEAMTVKVLGNVEFVVENTVVIKAKTSGEYQVLESGSVLCLEDRSVIGAIAETIGRVEDPMYTVRFTNEDAIKEAGVFEKGTTVYYVHEHSTFVFTQPLKGLKGSDASNIHDEEIGDDEMEFSDDEKEAEHKRQLKLKRQGRKDDGGRGGRGRGRGGQQSGARLPAVPESNGTLGSLDYDDGEGYTPLARPANLHEMMTGAEPGELPDGSTQPRPNTQRGGFQNNRGGRGRGRGGPNNRGGRGGGRGYPQAPFTPNTNTTYNSHQPAPFPFPAGPFPTFQTSPPAAPQLTPQSTAANFAPANIMPFSPSPISPLPSSGAFNFPQPNNPFPNFGAGMPFPPPPPPPQMFGVNQQQQYQQPPPQQQQGGGQQNFSSAANQAAFAQVQRQLQEMQRASQQQQQQQQQQGGYQR